MLAEYINSFLSNMNVLARRIASSNDLSLSQYYTLNNIISDGITMSALSSLIGIDNSTLTRNINILLKRNFVTKKRSQNDRREFKIHLSLKGDKMVTRLDKQMEDKINFIISEISPEEKEKLIDTIEQINWRINSYIHEL